MDTASRETRSCARCVRELYDLNEAMVDAIAGMLPVLRERARQRAVAAAQEQVRLAEQKLARLVAEP